MKILYIHQYFTTPNLGGGTRSYEFAKKLVQKGHQVTMLTGQNSGILAGKSSSSMVIDGIRVIFASTKYANQMNYLQRCGSFVSFAFHAITAGLASEKPDVIYASSTPLTVAIPGILLAMRFGVPMVFEVRDLWPEAPIQMGAIKNPVLIRFLRWFEKYVYGFSRHIVALSPGMVKGVLAAGVSKDKVSMIPNCCDLELFQSDSAINGNLDNMQLPDGDIISYCGAISDANGVELIIEAAELLWHEKVPLTIVFAGEGRLRPVLEERVKSKGLGNVIFLGKINKYQVAELYKRSIGCLVLFKGLPILSTNSPNKFFDALAAGRPVITNMGGWVADLVLENYIGINAGKDSADELTTAIKLLKGLDVQERTAMGQRARRLAEEQFDRNKMALKLEKILANSIMADCISNYDDSRRFSGS